MYETDSSGCEVMFEADMHTAVTKHIKWILNESGKLHSNGKQTTDVYKFSFNFSVLVKTYLWHLNKCFIKSQINIKICF